MPTNCQIDSRAVIDSRAHLAADVAVGPYSIIGADVSIASGTVIGPHVVIKGPTEIGEENRIFQFASIGEDPQDKKYEGEDSRLVIGDRNTIREFCTINRGTQAGGGITRIGNDNWIMAYVHIAHDCLVGNDITFSNGTTLAGHVVIEDYVVFGGFTLIHQFCRVGAYSFCGMGTALNKDLPPYVMAAGNLAKTYGLNKEGLRRRQFSESCIAALHRAYKSLVISKLPFEQQVESIAELGQQFDEVNRLVEFIRASKRGIVR